MKIQKIMCAVLMCVFVAHPIKVSAMETDQYNLPTTPLADIGGEFTEFAALRLKQEIEKINSKIDLLTECLRSEVEKTSCGSREKVAAKLARFRSEDALAKAVFRRLGDGVIPFTKAGFWVETHKFDVQPARFKAGIKSSIHVTAPLNFLTISPTVRMYGEEFGTDKISHVFEQGFDYYAIYRRELRKGKSDEEAVSKAIKFGQKTERTYYGFWVSAIFSNADLAANYAGLKFYQGLTHELEIGGVKRPAIVRLEDGKWVINESIHLHDYLVKPFVSRHLNEAYNPSKILNLAGYRDVVRKRVKENACPQWFARDPSMTQESLESVTKSLELWHGESYGFTPSKKFVTIANTCFTEDQEGREDD
jgi:hypothetical protein